MKGKRITTAAAVYVRISSDAEGTGLGVKRQRADCEALADRLGWTVVETYEDNDVSASKGKPRPAYERMMGDVAAGRIHAVVVWDVDRLTRTPRELEDVIDHADRLGLRLASVGGDIDLATEQGRMLARMKGTVARYEVEQSARRLRRKHVELAAAGRYNGPRPFGWDQVKVDGGPAVLRINKAEATVIREAVKRVLAGEGLWRIAGDLNDRGITTSTGGPWHTQTLRRMLLRWTNCGYRQHQPRRNGQPDGPPTLHRGQWDPIIDRETHERVVATLTDPSRRANNRGTAVKYLLTSKALCGVCREYVVGTAEFTYDVKVPPRKGETGTRTRTRTYPRSYKCPHRGCMKVSRRMDDVDEVVESIVVGLLTRDGVRLLGGNPEAVEHSRARVDALEAKLSLAADQYADDLITADQLARITAKVRPDLDAERERLRRAQPNEALAPFVGEPAAEAWKGADVETKRRVLDALDVEVILPPIGAGNGRAEPAEYVVVRPKEKAA